MRLTRAPFLAVLLLSTAALADEFAGPAHAPDHASGIYALGETAGGNVTLPWISAVVTYVTRKNNLAGGARVAPSIPGEGAL